MKSCLLVNNGERLDPIHQGHNLGNGYRTYIPVIMRFACPDTWSPFGAGGTNPYSYCAGDPTNRADPTGHMGWQAGLGIGLGTLSIFGAILTGGISLVVAGSVSVALAGTSTLSMVIGLVAMCADVTSIASSATEREHPYASAWLGWISFAAGVLSFGTGLLSGGLRVVNSMTAGLRMRMGTIMSKGLSGRGAVGLDFRWAEQNSASINQAVFGVERAEQLFPYHFKHPLEDLEDFWIWGKSGRGHAMAKFVSYYHDRNPGMYEKMYQMAEQQINDPFYRPEEIVRCGYRIAQWLQEAGQLDLPPAQSRNFLNLFSKSPREVAISEVNKLTFYRAEEFLAVAPDPIAVKFLSNLYEKSGIKEPLRFITPQVNSTGFGPW